MLVLERRLYFGTSGIKDYTKKTNSIVTVFPNPTNEFVNISIDNQTIQSIKIYNHAGQLLREKHSAHFSISDFPSGLLFLSIHTDKGIFNEKVIKQ